MVNQPWSNSLKTSSSSEGNFESYEQIGRCACCAKGKLRMTAAEEFQPAVDRIEQGDSGVKVDVRRN